MSGHGRRILRPEGPRRRAKTAASVAFPVISAGRPFGQIAGGSSERRVFWSEGTQDPMQKPTYIDNRTREAVRTRAISYIATDVPIESSLGDYAPAVSGRTGRRVLMLRRITGRTPRLGAKETTAGGW